MQARDLQKMQLFQEPEDGVCVEKTCLLGVAASAWPGAWMSTPDLCYTTIRSMISTVSSITTLGNSQYGGALFTFDCEFREHTDQAACSGDGGKNMAERIDFRMVLNKYSKRFDSEVFSSLGTARMRRIQSHCRVITTS